MQLFRMKHLIKYHSSNNNIFFGKSLVKMTHVNRNGLKTWFDSTCHLLGLSQINQKRKLKTSSNVFFFTLSDPDQPTCLIIT